MFLQRFRRMCPSTCVLMPHLSLGDLSLCCNGAVSELLRRRMADTCVLHRKHAVHACSTWRRIPDSLGRIFWGCGLSCVAVSVEQIAALCHLGLLALNGNSADKRQCCGLWTATNQGRFSNRTKTRKALEIYGELEASSYIRSI